MTDVRMKGFGKRSSVTEVLELIESRVKLLGSERVPFRSALGCVLAENVECVGDIPPHPKSAMDGFAIRAADVPGKLEVIGAIKAAERFEGKLKKKQAVQIMTGANIPDGADTVVMIEETKREGETVEIDSEQSEGHHILKAGEDLRAGQTVLSKGRILKPQDIALLVSVGHLEVQVRQRPRVRIVPTGTELVPAGAQPERTQVVESNSYMLEGLARRDGAVPIVHPIVRDDQEVLKKVLLEPEADVIVVTGGSSVGEEDYSPVVVREVGELPVHGVYVKPGSPTGVGFIGDTVCVLAPGFPVSSYVAWDLFVRPIVHRMAGIEAPLLPYKKMKAQLVGDHKKPAERVEIQRVTVNERSGGLPIASIIKGGAALLSTVTKATGFLYLPAGEEQFKDGQEVEVHLY